MCELVAMGRQLSIVLTYSNGKMTDSTYWYVGHRMTLTVLWRVMFFHMFLTSCHSVKITNQITSFHCSELIHLNTLLLYGKLSYIVRLIEKYFLASVLLGILVITLTHLVYENTNILIRQIYYSIRHRIVKFMSELEFEDIDLEEDEAITALSNNDLAIYTKALKYYLLHPSDNEALFLCISNALELSQLDNLPKSKLEDISAILEEISNLIDSAQRTVTDPTLTALLRKNKVSITRYLGPNYQPKRDFRKEEIRKAINPNYPLETPQLAATVRKMASEALSNRESGEEWKSVAIGLTSDGNDKSRQLHDDAIDEIMNNGLINLRERQKEMDKFLPQRELLRKYGKKTELSWEDNPEEYMRQKVMLPLADRLLKELKDW